MNETFALSDHQMLTVSNQEGQVYKSDKALSFIIVREPGLYYARIVTNEDMHVSRAVCVIKRRSGELSIGHVLNTTDTFFKSSTVSHLDKTSDVPCFASSDLEIGKEIGQGVLAKFTKESGMEQMLP